MRFHALSLETLHGSLETFDGCLETLEGSLETLHGGGFQLIRTINHYSGGGHLKLKLVEICVKNFHLHLVMIVVI